MGKNINYNIEELAIKLLKLFSIFFALFVLTIILQSCGNENLITAPQESKVNIKPMAKTVTLPTATIDHTIDTIITLPKSKITIVVKKNYPANKIAIMDDYFSTHTISKSPQRHNIKPYYQWCPYHYDSSWVLQNQYASVSGKNLGIWTNYISIYQARNQYGFTSLFVSSVQDIDSAINDGFTNNNLMWGLGSAIGDTAQVNTSTSGGRSVGSYCIDEPWERDNWDDYSMVNIASYVYPKRVMLVSYEWPS